MLAADTQGDDVFASVNSLAVARVCPPPVVSLALYSCVFLCFPNHRHTWFRAQLCSPLVYSGPARLCLPYPVDSHQCGQCGGVRCCCWLCAGLPCRGAGAVFPGDALFCPSWRGHFRKRVLFPRSYGNEGQSRGDLLTKALLRKQSLTKRGISVSQSPRRNRHNLFVIAFSYAMRVTPCVG